MLFLAGGGGEDDSLLLDERFIREVVLISPTPNVAYVPVAMGSRPYNECLRWFEEVFGDKFSIEMWTDLGKVDILALNNIDAIYIGGGNTVKLLSEIRTNGFDILLKQFVKNGGVVYGGSAGAIILGKDVRTAPETKHGNLQDFSGLDLLGGLSVLCHYEHNNGKEVLELIRNINCPVIAISERSGVICEDGKLTVIGYEPAFLFSGNGVFKYSPGESLQF